MYVSGALDTFCYQIVTLQGGVTGGNMDEVTGYGEQGDMENSLPPHRRQSYSERENVCVR